MPHRRNQLAVIALSTTLAVLLTPAAPALAHVEIKADKPQAGATNVTVTITGEAESVTAGIISEQVYLPAGITAADVRLGRAPAGWKLSTSGATVTVAGKALPVGKDAEFSLLIAQLPATARQLVFKTVERYADGKVSRWIQEPGSDGSEPENPAPVLKLKPAAARPSTPPTSTAATPDPTPSTPATTSAPAAPAEQDGNGLWWVAAVILVAAIAAGVFLLLRRRSTRQREG